jgi:hypothetical protein
LSENGKGNAEDIIEFDTLDLDEDKSSSNKITELQNFLKETLKPDKYSDAMKILGITDDMSNIELLEAVTLLLKKKEEEEEEKKDEKVASEEVEAAEKVVEEKVVVEDKKPVYKDFMDKCMKAGKSMADCSALYKEKYPEPKKEEIAEVEQLAESAAKAAKEEIELAKKKKKEDEYEHPEKKDEKKASKLAPEIRKELDELKAKANELVKVREEFDELKEGASELAKVREEFGELKQEASELAKVREEFDELKLELLRLKEERRLAEIAQKVDEQIDEKHLAPKQRDHVIKLMAKLPVMYHDDLLQTFATQKFRGFEDVGRTEVRRPGEPEEIDEETRLRLLREHGIDDLIAERGVKRRAN